MTPLLFIVKFWKTISLIFGFTVKFFLGVLLLFYQIASLTTLERQLSLSFHFPSSSLKNFYLFQGQLLSKFQKSFEIEMTFFSYLLHCLVAKKVRENRKEKKIFFIQIFNIIADVDVLMWNFLIPRMEIRESGKGNPRKCWSFSLQEHFGNFDNWVGQGLPIIIGLGLGQKQLVKWVLIG